MANYLVQVVDNGDGSWALGVFRGPANLGSGGTNLNTGSGSVSATTGLATSAQGFQQAGTNTADGLSHVLRNPQEVLQRALTMVVADRSFNG